MNNKTFYENEYNENLAATFSQGPGHRTRFRLSLQLIENYNFAPPLLDVGCGSGQLLETLSTKYGWQDIIGVDISQRALSQAKANNLNVKQMDLSTENLEVKEKFQSITCLQVLEHIKNDELVLNNIYDLLKNNGLLLCSVPYSEHYWSKMDKKAGHVRRYKDRELNQKISEAGFTIEYRLVWGAVIYNIYYRLLKYSSKNTRSFSTSETKYSWKKIISSILYYLFFIDDLFTFSNCGPRLFIVAKKN